jgi:hypothetical protein
MVSVDKPHSLMEKMSSSAIHLLSFSLTSNHLNFIKYVQKSSSILLFNKGSLQDAYYLCQEEYAIHR